LTNWQRVVDDDNDQASEVTPPGPALAITRRRRGRGSELRSVTADSLTPPCRPWARSVWSR